MNGASGHRVALAARAHFDAMREVELQAERAFSVDDLPLALRGVTLTSDEELEEALGQELLWSALDGGGAVVGYAIALWLGGDLHLDELDVHPAHQRRGVGRMLVERVRAHAAQGGARRLTLTTFRFVSWNMPWYERLGFVALEESAIPPLLREVYEAEIARGLPRARRVAMVLDLAA